jgi:hypothetical protein
MPRYLLRQWYASGTLSVPTSYYLRAREYPAHHGLECDARERGIGACIGWVEQALGVKEALFWVDDVFEDGIAATPHKAVSVSLLTGRALRYMPL